MAGSTAVPDFKDWKKIVNLRLQHPVIRIMLPCTLIGTSFSEAEQLDQCISTNIVLFTILYIIKLPSLSFNSYRNQYIANKHYPLRLRGLVNFDKYAISRDYLSLSRDFGDAIVKLTNIILQGISTLENILNVLLLPRDMSYSLSSNKLQN